MSCVREGPKIGKGAYPGSSSMYPVNMSIGDWAGAYGDVRGGDGVMGVTGVMGGGAPTGKVAGNGNGRTGASGAMLGGEEGEV